MRIRFVLTAVAAIAVSKPGMAQSQTDLNACNSAKTDPDQRIAACTRVIHIVSRIRSPAPALNSRANAWIAKGDYQRAISDLDESIRRGPHFYAYTSRGFALLRQGLPDRAISDFNEAIRLNPKFFGGYLGRAQAWREKNDFDRAFADSAEAIRLSPKSPLNFTNRALFWRDRGDYDRAIADSNEAIRVDPKHALSWANRGDIWRLKGDLDRALTDLNEAIRLEPKAANHHTYRGDTLRYKGEYIRALADYDQALRIRPAYVPALTGRGLTFLKMGDRSRARSAFDQAINSNDQWKSDESKSARETALAQIEAVDSGAEQPTIPIVASKAQSTTSIPTSSAVVPLAKPALDKQGRRAALVIGNSEYKNVAALTNPKNDADAIAKSLRAVGFDSVTLVNDTTRETLIDSLRIFANEAEHADWAMVYYAGHGIEVGGINYLIPIDARLAVDRDIEYEAVALTQVLRAADSAKKIKLVMLDACRDNPFKPRKTDAPAAIAASESTAGRVIATRSTNGRGLAEVKVSGATLVVFAAKDGQVALDGDGGNSPFAVAVVQRLATPGVEINKIFRLVRDDVMEATAGRQEPYTYGSLPGKEDFYFVAK